MHGGSPGSIPGSLLKFINSFQDTIRKAGSFSLGYCLFEIEFERRFVWVLPLIRLHTEETSLDDSTRDRH